MVSVLTTAPNHADPDENGALTLLATHEDARLIIDLSRWAQEWGFHDANRWVRSHVTELTEYDTFIVEHPPGSNEYKHPFTVLGYFENVGLFHKHNVIDEPLLFDWLDFEGPWKLLGDFALAHRTDAGEPTLWCNFEALARHQQQRRATDG